MYYFSISTISFFSLASLNIGKGEKLADIPIPTKSAGRRREFGCQY